MHQWDWAHHPCGAHTNGANSQTTCQPTQFFISKVIRNRSFFILFSFYLSFYLSFFFLLYGEWRYECYRNNDITCVYSVRQCHFLNVHKRRLMKASIIAIHESWYSIHFQRHSFYPIPSSRIGIFLIKERTLWLHRAFVYVSRQSAEMYIVNKSKGWQDMRYVPYISHALSCRKTRIVSREHTENRSHSTHTNTVHNNAQPNKRHRLTTPSDCSIIRVSREQNFITIY